MKYLFLFTTLLTFHSFGAKEYYQPSGYIILSDEVDSALLTKSKVTFRINEQDSQKSKKIVYSVNGLEKTAKTTTNTEILELVDAGKHNFEFVLNKRHYEIFIKDLDVKHSHHVIVQLNFQLSNQTIHVKKPVIYLYPETKTEVNIQLNTTGDLTFTYPEYNDGWSVTADSLGNITNNGETFNYLFWEGEHQFNTTKLDSNQGVIVPQNELVSYLEGALTKFGFTSKEKADFITYWVPNMKDVTNLYIYFLFNEACDEFATLDISPEPSQSTFLHALGRRWNRLQRDWIAPTGDSNLQSRRIHSFRMGRS
ncbi:MAG: hypothetical protein ACJASQ_000298 [Crocinitomicaceae bacterium]|jgi:hypothetical protein